jgi:inner membrane protein involved in colicin E2 resistance
MKGGDGMADLLPWSIVSIMIPVLIVLIAILIMWKILKDRKSGFPSADERTQRITGKASTYALLIGNYFTIALMFMLIFGRELYNLQNVDAGYLLLSTLLVSSTSFLVLSWVFSRKGD